MITRLLNDISVTEIKNTCLNDLYPNINECLFDEFIENVIISSYISLIGEKHLQYIGIIVHVVEENFSGRSNCTMYDYIEIEASGYVNIDYVMTEIKNNIEMHSIFYSIILNLIGKLLKSLSKMLEVSSIVCFYIPKKKSDTYRSNIIDILGLISGMFFANLFIIEHSETELLNSKHTIMRISL